MRNVIIGVVAAVLVALVATQPGNPPDPSKPAVKPDDRFIALHNSFIARDKQGPIGVLFLGDSITECWRTQAGDVWVKHFGQYEAANFGIIGDCTQHVLWRIGNGELDANHPKVIVLMIGTNNIAQGATAAAVAGGVTAIVDLLGQKSPQSKILLLGIFPRADAIADALRKNIPVVNQTLSKLDDGKHIFYMDIGGKFLLPDGTLAHNLFIDDLHPNTDGYKVWADAIGAKLDELMKS